ncbi:hypothetical protein JCM33374_g805 [Metschnikowia sp. JCM 33374]|nr:hypothetical protein JCM33374_g805 [Metschnikowia sp. JCM 33374]
MKVSSILATLAFSVVTASAASDFPTTVASVDALITDGPVLEKRFKDVIVNEDYKHMQSLRLHGSDAAKTTLKPWIRTIYDTKVEIVTPVLIAGVTISAKPPQTTNGLEPWISLKSDGSPTTIVPKMKNGIIKDKSPDYGTYFQTATTVRYTKEELKAHNMKDDEVFHEETFVEEDLTYRSLNPILRCTPDSYKMKGLGKDKSPEPFCFPRDNTRLYKDHTYFFTWYYRFFDDSVENVRLHLSYVKESARQKGTKRGLIEDELAGNGSQKRSTIMEQGGSLSETSFFVSDWMPKEEGILPLIIDQEWLQNDYYKKILVSLQPDNISDEEFDHMSNFIVIEIAQRPKVAKEHAVDIAAQEEKQRMKALHGDSYDVEEGLDYEKYMIIMTMPTCVMLAVLFMYIFVWYNKRNHDLSFLKKVKFSKKSSKLPFRRKKESRYTELPQWDGPKSD